MRRYLKSVGLISAAVLSLAGCGDSGVSEVRDWMTQVQKESRVVVPKVSEPKVYVPVPYSGADSVDPFNQSKLLTVLAKLKAESGGALKPDMERRREALEAYPLDALKMVGIIEKPNMRHALIQMDKTIFQAKVGNYIGQNFGMITKITDTEVEIKEIVQDAAGDWTERQAKLELQEDKK
jgi:type IV pilus assembly protein PilP